MDCFKNCLLYKDCQTPCLPGFGYRKAEIVLIGEAPGAVEDTCGRPFVGKSGDVLNRVLKQVGISRDDLFITNAVRCRPVDNKTPLQKAITHCRPHLIRELQAVNPKIIITMGGVALHSIIGSKKAVNQWRGATLGCDELPNSKVIPTLHPAATFRKKDAYDKIVQDFTRAKHLLQNNVGKSEKDYQVLQNDVELVEKFLEELKGKNGVAFDLETTGFDFLTDRILCVSFSERVGHARVIPILGYQEREIWNSEEKGRVIKALGNYFGSQGTKIGQNLQFDINFCRAYGWTVKNVVMDTMVAHHLIDELSLHNLDYLASRYTESGSYKTDWNKKHLPKATSTYAEVPEDILWKRALEDADVTKEVSINLRRILIEEELNILYDNLSNSLFQVLTKAVWNGIKLNEEKMREAGINIKESISKLRARMFKLVGAEFNPNSPKQLKSILFDQFKLPIIRSGKSGPSTDKEVLAKLEGKHPIISTLLDYRKNTKALSTYIGDKEEKTGLWQYLGIDDRVHVKFKTTGTVTGRISSYLHTIPRPSGDVYKIRNMFTVEEGNDWMGGDYSQAELRVLAWYSQDPTMLEVFARGEDIHEAVASKIFNCDPKDVTKEQRVIAKQINFGIVYGRGPDSLAIQMGVSTAQAQKFLDDFFRQFSHLKRWMDQEKAKACKLGYVRNAFGRYRRFPELKILTNYYIASLPYYEQGKARGRRAELLRQVINFLIQGSTSDAVSAATIRLDKRYSDDIKFVMTHHDALYYEVPKTVIIVTAQVFIEEMQRPIPQLGNMILPVDLSVGDFWGDDTYTESVLKKVA